MNGEEIPGDQLDDEELIARGIISVEPTKRDLIARAFARMAWGIFTLLFLVTAPLGYLVIYSAAARLRGLHRDIGQVRKLAVGSAVVSALALIGGIRAGSPGAASTVVFVSWLLWVATLLLSVVLVWRLCAVVADVAKQSAQDGTRSNALFRRRFYLGFSLCVFLMSLPEYVGGFAMRTGDSVILFGLIVLKVGLFAFWVVIVCLLWGLMRQAEGIVRYSEAFAYLDESPDDMAPEPA